MSVGWQIYFTVQDIDLLLLVYARVLSPLLASFQELQSRPLPSMDLSEYFQDCFLFPGNSRGHCRRPCTVLQMARSLALEMESLGETMMFTGQTVESPDL